MSPGSLVHSAWQRGRRKSRKHGIRAQLLFSAEAKLCRPALEAMFEEKTEDRADMDMNSRSH